MAQIKPPCEKCNQPSSVHISSGPGHPWSVRHLCLACAEQEDRVTWRKDQPLNRAAVYVVIGALIFVLAAAADELRFGHADGFGYRQMIGVLAAGAIFTIGALTRTATLMAIGGFVAGV